MCEYAWSSIQSPAKIFRYSVQLEKGKIHPTQKPEQLYKWILNLYAKCKTCKSEGGYYEDVTGDGGSQMWIDCDECNGIMPKILDTHVGSGSSLIAFEDFGCEYVGYEIDKDYYESALKRLNQHKAQLTIF